MTLIHDGCGYGYGCDDDDGDHVKSVLEIHSIQGPYIRQLVPALLLHCRSRV